MTLGLKLGKERLFEYIKKFGFGSKTNIDLNGESKGILFNINNIGLLELATTAFGQGVSVTPIQQVNAVSAIINNGNLYKPYVVSSTSDKIFSPTLINSNIISSETSSLVRYALESVVANGSGRNAYIENYRVGGKTGTAQKVGSDGRYMENNYILSFIGFLPADDPLYTVYIAIDNAKGVTQYGGVVSAPIAKNVMEDIISIYDIKSDSDGIPKSYKWDDIKYVTIPNLIGMTKKEVRRALNGFEIIFIGSGDKVIDSQPSSLSRVKEGSTIRIMLN